MFEFWIRLCYAKNACSSNSIIKKGTVLLEPSKQAYITKKEQLSWWVFNMNNKFLYENSEDSEFFGCAKWRFFKLHTEIIRTVEKHLTLLSVRTKHVYWKSEFYDTQFKTVLVNLLSEVALQRCSYKKVFRRYAANLQENTHAQVDFNKVAKQFYWNLTLTWVFSRM